MQGYIKLHRVMTENELYFSERFTKVQAWVDMLLLANHKPATVFIRGIEIRLRAGELCYSQLTLAKRWKWDRKTVSTYLSMLSQRGMLDIRISQVTSIISIRNWNRYQGNGQQIGQQKDNRTDTDKNDKNGTNVFVEELIETLRENGIQFDERHLRVRIPKAYREYGEEVIRAAVNEAQESWTGKGHTGNFVAYLFTVIERNYGGNGVKK